MAITGNIDMLTFKDTHATTHFVDLNKVNNVLLHKTENNTVRISFHFAHSHVLPVIVDCYEAETIAIVLENWHDRN